ncbi:MAG: flagellar export chaperone FliS [Tissierellia bacterium]|nr:flagellar export chaperone FliS [Tissierellia bacterium]
MSYDAFNAYKQNSIMTASPEELTLMLYEGCIKFMNIAKEKMRVKDVQGAHNAIIRADDIITELNATLDMKYEISTEFRDIYIFVEGKLLDANLRKDISAIEDAIKVMQNLRDLWKEMMKVAKEANLKAR